MPQVISAAEWNKPARGIVQRVRVSEMLLVDIYGDAEIVRDGVLPQRLITCGGATGRDHADIPPLKGVYPGGTASALDVTVDMTRLA